MSKIEKALDRAKQSRGMALVRTTTGDKTSAEPSPAAERERRAEKPRQKAISRKASAEAIARMKESALRTRSDLAALHIISPDLGNNPTVQAFREIRTRVAQQMQAQNGIIMVTGVSGGGGNSFVSRNLAVAFAFDAGSTSLLVDCNFHNPSLHNFLHDKEKSKGITDYLDDPELTLGEIIHPVGIQRLRVMPTGTRHDVTNEYFLSDRVRHLLSEIRDRYPERYVILDAPPMTESADARILEGLCDYVLLVVPYATLTTEQIDNCIKSIDSRKLIGVIFNNEPLLPTIELTANGLWGQFKLNLAGSIAKFRSALHELTHRKSRS